VHIRLGVNLRVLDPKGGRKKKQVDWVLNVEKKDMRFMGKKG